MSEQQAEKLLAVLVLARSSSYLMSKFVLGELDTFNLLALRFLIAFAVLLVVLHKHCRQVKGKVLFHGAVIGTTFFLTLAAELTALHSAPSTTVSFLENCSIVLVPLMAAALRRRFPGKSTIGSAALAIFGVALLTLGRSGGMSLSAGEGTALLAAYFRRGLVVIVKRVCRPEGVILSRRRAQAVGGQAILQRHGVTRLDGKLSGASVDLGCGRVLGRGVRAGVDFRRGNSDFRRPRRLCLECQGYDLRGSGLIRAVADNADASALFGYRSPFIRRLTGHIGQPRGVIGQCQIVGIVLSPGDGHAHADGLPNIRSLIRRSGDRIARFRGINSHGQGGQKHYKSKQTG